MNPDLVTLISTQGFAIAVAAYLLIRVERTLRELSESIAELRSNITVLGMELKDVARDFREAGSKPLP